MNKWISSLGMTLALTPLSMAFANASTTTVEPTYSLNFDVSKYTEVTKQVNGKEITYRAYENIVYVSKPVDTTYESMNIYIPEAYFHDGNVNGYTKNTAPIFFPNSVGGYMPGKPSVPGFGGAFGPMEGDKDKPDSETMANAPQGMGQPPEGMGRPPQGMGQPPQGMGRPPQGMDSQQVTNPFDDEKSKQQPNAALMALSQGLVVASPAARGRTNQNDQKEFTGKAPAAIVDLKAAVRYLHFNDSVMPGDANRIISNGTSAGGALSALLGATGNDADYEPYLQKIGAAEASDAIYAVSAYCPITNLDHADMAYEWQFNGYDKYKAMSIQMLDYHVQRTTTSGTLTAKQKQVSSDLAAQFPTYLNSLHLVGPQGQPLTLDKNGEGSFKDYVKSLIIMSAQQALSEGKDLSGYDFLTIHNGVVMDVDFSKYRVYAIRQKLPPAFDALDLSAGENNLFGNEHTDSQHFTDYSSKNSTIKATRVDAKTVKLMNPMDYLDSDKAQKAEHWRIRVGTDDRDTSLAISAILATKLKNLGYDVNYMLPWDRPHSGDYDLSELFNWILSITK